MRRNGRPPEVCKVCKESGHPEICPNVATEGATRHCTLCGKDLPKSGNSRCSACKRMNHGKKRKASGTGCDSEPRHAASAGEDELEAEAVGGREGGAVVSVPVPSLSLVSEGDFGSISALVLEDLDLLAGPLAASSPGGAPGPSLPMPMSPSFLGTLGQVGLSASAQGPSDDCHGTGTGSAGAGARAGPPPATLPAPEPAVSGSASHLPCCKNLDDSIKLLTDWTANTQGVSPSEAREYLLEQLVDSLEVPNPAYCQVASSPRTCLRSEFAAVVGAAIVSTGLDVWPSSGLSHLCCALVIPTVTPVPRSCLSDCCSPHRLSRTPPPVRHMVPDLPCGCRRATVSCSCALGSRTFSSRPHPRTFECGSSCSKP
jgi:hypothetical protein